MFDKEEEQEHAIIKKKTLEELVKELYFLDDSVLPKLLEIKELENTIPSKESLEEVNRNIAGSQDALERIFNMIHNYFNTEVERVTELEDKYDDLFKGMDNSILGKKVVFQEMLNQVIQEVVQNIDLTKVDTGKMKEIFQAKFQEIHLKPLTDFVVQGEKSVLKAFESAMMAADVTAMISSKIEDLQSTINSSINILNETAEHKMEMLDSRAKRIAESVETIDELLSDEKLEDIEKRLTKTEKVNKKGFNNFYFFFGLLIGSPVGAAGLVFIMLYVDPATIVKLTQFTG